MIVERAALSAAHATEKSNMEEPELIEYQQANLTCRVLLYEDGFVVHDPWDQVSEKRSLDRLEKTLNVLDSMRFMYTIEDTRVVE